MKICFIGNNAKGKQVSDGGRIKMRNIMSEYKNMGNHVSVIDLYKWQYRFLSIFFKLKKALMSFDFIIVMAGPKGSRAVLKLIYKMSKNKKAKVIFIPVGLGTIDTLVKRMDFEKLSNFINSINYYGIKDKKMIRYLSKIDLVVPENEILCSLYRDFYSLNNVLLLRNFRYGAPILKKHKNADGTLRIVFMSRITENKGVFDLIDVVNRLVNRGLDIKLDFYGEIQLKKADSFLSQMNKNIIYKGVCKSDLSVSVLSNYDLLCLPTKYYAEGTPGVVVESFFSGTPCLISSYCQVDSLIVHKQTGVVFRFNDVADLEEKMFDIFSKKYDMDAISENVFIESKKYSIDSARLVLKRIIGLEK